MAAEAEVAPGLIKARAAETAETIAGRELIKYEDEPLSPSFAAVGHRLKFFGDLQEPEYQEEQCRMEMVRSLAGIAASCRKDPGSSPTSGRVSNREKDEPLSEDEASLPDEEGGFSNPVFSCPANSFVASAILFGISVRPEGA